MDYQAIFKRYELKYLLTKEQVAMLKKEMAGRLVIDKYGLTSIRNIYFDTDDYRLIRSSLDKPVYKEKLRVRSYGIIKKDENVFVELKKKYEGIVYKRRISSSESNAMTWLAENGVNEERGQIVDEIDYFKTFYRGLKPKVFISYDREAYFSVDDTDIRITLDTNLTGRNTDLSLRNGVYGKRIIPADITVMEIKVPASIPLWLVRFLNENRIYKSSLSKYGKYYTDVICKNNDKGELKYA